MHRLLKEVQHGSDLGFANVPEHALQGSDLSPFRPCIFCSWYRPRGLCSAPFRPPRSRRLRWQLRRSEARRLPRGGRGKQCLLCDRLLLSVIFVGCQGSCFCRPLRGGCLRGCFGLCLGQPSLVEIGWRGLHLQSRQSRHPGPLPISTRLRASSYAGGRALHSIGVGTVRESRCGCRDRGCSRRRG